MLKVKALFTAPGITKDKTYEIENVAELSKIWNRKYLILDDNNEFTWCYDDEVTETT